MDKYFSITQRIPYKETLRYTKQLLRRKELTRQTAIANVFQHLTFRGEVEVLVNHDDQLDTEARYQEMFFELNFFGLSMVRLLQGHMPVKIYTELPKELR